MEKVLVVDDTRFTRTFICNLLKSNGIETIEATNGKEAINIVEARFDEIVAITLDREMPIMNGLEVVQEIKGIEKYSRIPILIITALDEKEEKEKGLQMGVYDYLTKPIDSYMTYLKLRNAIQFYKQTLKLEKLERKLKKSNQELEIKVKNKTEELENMTLAMITALENANLYNDENTGKHIERVSEYSKIIAQGAKLDKKIVKEITLYSKLHDIGKIGISDKILKKPGKYTDEEFEKMKKHVEIGYKMIKGAKISEVAKNIIFYHHEKWDGTGYSKGLKGEEIPIEARIVAIADVFDALTTERPYKKAFTTEKALTIMLEGNGKHFDPELIDILLDNMDRILEKKRKYKNIEVD
ncbi:MAG: hypothetical protein B6I28_01090 [Fusobacteriia bacterium 4572_132]|nr:MAG: hypothetical protein B6I28_01090 [Fusobacteriia bacterium 4572_132]